MISEFYMGLINNTCLLLTTGIIYFAFSFKDTKSTMLKSIFGGVILGVIGVFIMSSPVEYIPGVIFDTRSILIGLVGMFFGVIPTIIVAVAMCLYRILIGGSGTIMGISVILSTAVAGLLWNKFRLKYIVRKNSYVWLEFYLFGLVIHIVMLLCTLVLPWEIAINVFQNIFAPVIIIYPIGTFLLCMIIFKQLLSREMDLELKESDDKFQKTFFKNPAIMALTDFHTHEYINVNEAFINKIGYSSEEIIGKTPSELGLFYNENLKNEALKLLKIESSFSDLEFDVRAKDGRILNGLFSGELIKTKNSTQVLTVMIDITNIKRVEKHLKQTSDRLKLAIRAGGVGIWDYDIVNNNLFWDDQMFKLYGVEKKEFNNAYENWRDGLHPDDIERCDAEVDMAIKEEKDFDTEFRVCWSDGTIRNIRALAIIEKDELGHPLHMIGTNWDITERKQADEKIKESEYMLTESQKVAHIGSYANDVLQGTWVCSTELERIFGVDETYSHSLEGWLNIVHPDWRAKLSDYVSKVYSEKTFFDLEYKIIRNSDGEERWVHGLGKLEFDKNGNTAWMNGTIQDITERKLKEEETIYRSSHDVLTGLYNRRQLEEVLVLVEDSGDVPVSIIVGDVNSLKLINDAYGHSSGDVVLGKISKIIKEVCGENAYAARHGGDEFSIILPETTYEEAGMKVMQIKKRCEEESEDELMLTITFGVGTKMEKEQTLEEIQHLAEERMYTNKLLEGKNIRSSIVENLRIVLEEKTGETRNHCIRMSEMSQIIGEEMGFQEFEVANLKLLSLLHDIGKTAIPESILLKKDKLDQNEIAIMQKHCEIGYRIANTMPELVPISEGILCHHERWDGMGYPQGLAFDSIPMMSRIVAVLDTYDAMTNDRPYRKALSKKEAIEELKRFSGKQFDPEVVNVFLNNVPETEL